MHSTAVYICSMLNQSLDSFRVTFVACPYEWGPCTNISSYKKRNQNICLWYAWIFGIMKLYLHWLNIQYLSPYTPDTLAPYSISVWQTSSWPCFAARCKAVHSSSSFACISAPAPSNIDTNVLLPWEEAYMSGVVPSWKWNKIELEVFLKRNFVKSYL